MVDDRSKWSIREGTKRKTALIRRPCAAQQSSESSYNFTKEHSITRFTSIVAFQSSTKMTTYSPEEGYARYNNMICPKQIVLARMEVAFKSCFLRQLQRTEF